MKILHTSDIQLDAPFLFLGEGGKRHRQQIRDTFETVVKLADRERYDLLLIAGDLFDSNRPSQITVDLVSSLLRNLAIPVCVLPGNHDCYDTHSIYRKYTFPSNVVIFTEQRTEQMLPELDVTVHGKAIRRPESTESPLMDVHRTGKTRFEVAIAHGNLVGGVVESPPRPIQPKEIEDCGMDYVALGDWHAFSDRSEGRVRACYSGAPEPMAFDQEGCGFVASVALDVRGIDVKPVRVGKIAAKQVSIDVTGKTAQEVLEEILDRADPNLMLEVSLIGLQREGEVLSPEELGALLSPRFYALRFRDLSHPEVKAASEADYSHDLVIGRFADLMHKRIQSAEDEAKKHMAERALQVGIALLQGKEVS